MKQQINEIKRMQHLAGVINEEDTSMDIEREEYINEEINIIIEAIKNLQEEGLGSVDYILDMVKKEMEMKSTSIPAPELPFM